MPELHGVRRDSMSNRDRDTLRGERSDQQRQKRHRSHAREGRRHNVDDDDDDRASHRRRDEHRHMRPRSRSREQRRDRRRSPSPGEEWYGRRRRKSRSRSPAHGARSSKPLPSQAESFGAVHGEGEGDGNDNGNTKAADEKQKPNFNNTGLLARDTNVAAGTDIVLKYNEPSDARKAPASQDWRLYIFKGPEALGTIPLRTRSCWLLGREHAVADVPLEHPSCSKQHAVVQFRHRVKANEFGDKDFRVRPYIIDLESSNGTLLNGEKIATSRYLELKTSDVLKFGLSEREYVVIMPPATG